MSTDNVEAGLQARVEPDSQARVEPDPQAPVEPDVRAGEHGLTPFQPVGPFFHLWIGDERRGFASLVREGTRGERITVAGRLLDGGRAPVRDGLVEIWQADAAGHYRHPADPAAEAIDPAFGGYGRTATDSEGRFRFDTVKPGSVAGPGGGVQAPHILVRVYAPGILTPYWTRLYFEDEAANGTDPVLQAVSADRRPTLVGQRAGDEYRWDIVLQGADETVFFDA